MSAVPSERKVHVLPVSCIAVSVVDEVRDRAAQRKRSCLDREVTDALERQGKAATKIVGVDLLQQGPDIEVDVRLALAVTTEVDELPDDAIHLLNVGHHRLPLFIIGWRHLHPQAQACQRCAQIVGHACEDEAAIGIEAGQIAGHLVEGAGHVGDVRGAPFG